MAQRLTSSVLLHVESSQKTDGIIATPTTLNLIARLDVSAIATTRRVRDTQSTAAIWELRWLRGWMGARSLSIGADGKRVGMDAKDTTSAAKLVVDGTKVDLLDPELSQQRCAHDAWFDGDVEDALANNGSINSLVGMTLLAVGVEVPLGAVFVALVGRYRRHRRGIGSRR